MSAQAPPPGPPGPPEAAEAPPRGRPIGMVALLAIVAAGIAAIFWGRLVVNPQPQVFLFDAGPAAGYAVGEPRWFPGARIFVIALDDDGSRKRIRALDAIARGTGCTVELRPGDPRGASSNPRGRAGVYADPCSGGVWALDGAAIAGSSSPLRTFRVTRPQPEDAQGRPLIEVEVIGRPDPRATPDAR